MNAADAARRQWPSVTPVWLDLGPATLAWRRAPGGEALATLPLGDAAVGARFFAGERPRSVELERGIDFVEDALMAALPHWPAGAVLVSTDARWLAATGLAGEADTEGFTTVSTAAVEAAFQRLASGALGDASAWRELPTGREAAARLLVLRETLHHLGLHGLHLWRQPG
jgi:hypothetical protein